MTKVETVVRWIDDYNKFLTYNQRDSGNIAINSLGLVGGAFTTDNPLTSYTPPTTSASEAQLLTLRGSLKSYLVTGNKAWLERAELLTHGLLNHYYPTPEIPMEPDDTWVPHWMVNVTAPFTSREWGAEGIVNFTNGVGISNIEKIFKVFSVRAMDATLKYDWTMDAPVVGVEYEIESVNVEYGKSKATITLKDKTFTGQAKIAYSQETGPIIEIGDKCEAYPVWRPLDEGEIACAVDALPWAMDVFNLWLEITGDEKWNRAIESTKAAIVTASDVTNMEYFIKSGEDNEEVMKYGLTNFSTRTPKESYRNQNGLILIDYPASEGEGTFGTWIGNRKEFTNEQWIDVRVGSTNPTVVTVFIDEDAEYHPDKRWRADIAISGNGIGQSDLEDIELFRDDFYKADDVVWGVAYGKSTDGSVIASGQSSVAKSIVNDGNNSVVKLDFVRGDEGGWLGWAQFMLSLWDYPLPFEISYKTDSEINFVVNDSENVKHEYILPKTNGKYNTIELTEEMLGGDFASGRYASIVLESISEEASINIDYFGYKHYFDKMYFSNINFSYSQPEAVQIALEYLKPGPSRTKLPYAPYLMPFDFHLLNYEISDLRGAIYTGYQAPWIYQEGIFPDKATALNTNLQFLKDSQDAYESLIGIRGFFAPIFWWDYRDDYGDNEPNTFDIEGNWGPVWGGFQYRTISDVARVFVKDPSNRLAYVIFIDFIKAMDEFWIDIKNGFPTAFDEGKLPYNNQTDSHMVSNFMRSLLYGVQSTLLTMKDKKLIKKLLDKCFDFLEYYHIPVTNFSKTFVEGTWSPNPNGNVWYQYWGGDILDGLSTLIQLFPSDLYGKYLYNINYVLDGYNSRKIEVEDNQAEININLLQLDVSLKLNEVYVISATIKLLDNQNQEIESNQEFYTTFTNTDPDLKIQIYADSDEVKYIELAQIKIESEELTEWTPAPKDIFVIDNSRAIRSKYKVVAITWRPEEREVIHTFSRQTLQDRLLLPESGYVQTAGQNGKTVYAYERQYRDGRPTDEIRGEVIKEYIEPVTEIVVVGTMKVEWRLTTVTEEIPFGRTIETNSNILPANSYLKSNGTKGTNTYSVEQKIVNDENTGEIRNRKLISTVAPKNEVYVQGTMQVNWRNESRVESVPYGTTIQSSNIHFEDERIVSVVGVLGKRTFTWQAEFVNNVRTGNTRNHANSILAGDEPKNEIVLVGTRKRSILANDTIKPSVYNYYFKWNEKPKPEKSYKLYIKPWDGYSMPTGFVNIVRNDGLLTYLGRFNVSELPVIVTGDKLTVNASGIFDAGLTLNSPVTTKPVGYTIMVEEQL